MFFKDSPPPAYPVCLCSLRVSLGSFLPPALRRGARVFQVAPQPLAARAAPTLLPENPSTAPVGLRAVGWADSKTYAGRPVVRFDEDPSRSTANAPSARKHSPTSCSTRSSRVRNNQESKTKSYKSQGLARNFLVVRVTRDRIPRKRVEVLVFVLPPSTSGFEHPWSNQ